ncbi:MAG: hypothetical protein Q9167_001740 [Letrouitia subvulpina]
MSTPLADYIAVGGNRHPEAADWDSLSGLVAYGAGENIAIWRPSQDGRFGILSLLRGHDNSVTAIKFLPFVNDGKRALLSGSVDCTVRLWQGDSSASGAFENVKSVTAHRGSVNCLAVSPHRPIFASGSADATVKLWKASFTDGTWDHSLLQTISLVPKFLPLSLALSCLDGDDFILAIGGTKSSLDIYSTEQKDNFTYQTSIIGHENWIRSLAIQSETQVTGSDRLLASASQDKYIRLWRIQRLTTGIPDPDQLTVTSDLTEISNRNHILKARNNRYLLSFEALLVGHEDWVYKVSWQNSDGTLRLLSASADNSLAIWSPDAASGIWICTARLGEISAQKGSTTATGSSGGLWMGLWSPDGKSVASLGRTGSWSIWNHDEGQDSWQPGIGVSGHTKPVMDLSWSKDNSLLLSTSHDQTTRLFAEWDHGENCTWHEFGRPQIHGYDLNCINFIGSRQFVSGGDEKLLRVFDEPRATASLLQKLSLASNPVNGDMPDGASIPVLGLSNKAIKDSDESQTNVTKTDREDVASNFLKSDPNVGRDRPPLEADLSRYTLWPEEEKLYGHGNEIAAMAVSNSESVIATACKASSVNQAVIRLFDTQEWREITPPLTVHSLTVTCLRFSNSDQHLLSVGRDRQWAVFEKNEMEPHLYQLRESRPKAHSRMILSACWAPAPVGTDFATAGRDKVIKFWRLQDGGAVLTTTVTTTLPVTAIDILPLAVEDMIIFASGAENGEISVYNVQLSTFSVSSFSLLTNEQRPSKAITRLAWRPPPTAGMTGREKYGERRQQQHDMQLAVASEDNSLRVISIPPKPGSI